MQTFDVVNRPLPRVDAYEKATGRLKYGADMVADNMLYAKILFAPHPHAKLTRVDTAEAESLPGVVKVATWKDVMGDNIIGELRRDQSVFAKDKTRYMGDAIAAVAAETEQAAEEALSKIVVEYEELHVLSTMEDALLGEVAVHPDYPDNVCARHHFRKGNVEEGFAEADVILEREYETQFIEHAYIETEAVLAIPGPGARELTVVGSIQAPYAVRESMVRALKLPMSRIRVVQQAIGGTFGGKLEPMDTAGVRVGLLALLTGRPVKLVYSREESIRDSHKRHPYKMRYKIGAKKDGTICVIQANVLADSGAYACQTLGVTNRSAVQGCGPYRVPHTAYDIRGVYTNNPYTGSMRGYGSPQTVFGIESIVTELAGELGITPREIREKNALVDNDRSPTDHHLTRHTVSVKEVLEKACTAIDFNTKWQRYQEKQSGAKRRGIGLACSMRGVALGAEGLDAARCYLEVAPDASVVINLGLTEHGQGLRTAMSQIAAEALGCAYERLTYNDTDTSRAPDTGPTVASRGTVMGGGAILDAGKQIYRILQEAVADGYGANAEDVVIKNDRVRFGGKEIGFEEAVAAAYGTGKTPAAIGSHVAPEIHWDEEKGCGEGYFTYVYACQAAEVEVDIETGKIDVLKVTAAHDVGCAINPHGVAGQIYGGVAMAAGYAVMEDLAVEDSVIKHTNLDEYMIPTAMDVTDIDIIIVENPDRDGPYGAKCIGESSTELGAAAIAAAVNQATGETFRALPLTLERVFLGKPLRKNVKRGSAR